jgi:hypothetical protein
MAMPKENLPSTPPNTEPGPMRDDEDLAEDLDENRPSDEAEDTDADSSGLGPRGQDRS